MGRTSFGCVIGMALVAVIAGAEEAPIRRVTVYNEGAMVTRTQTVQVAAGVGSIVFSGLTEDLDEYSIRAWAEAADGVSITGVILDTVHLTELTSGAERRAAAEVERLQDEIQRVDDQIAVLDLRLGFLGSIADRSSATAVDQVVSGAIDPTRWQEAWTTLEKGASEARERKLEAQISRRRLVEELDRARRELEQIRSGRRNLYSATVSYRSSAAQGATIALAYLVDEASWEATYEAHLDSVTDEVRLAFLAEVSQDSGEDWKDVELTLSTADPTRDASLPRLGSRYLDFAAPMPLRSQGFAGEVEVAASSNSYEVQGMNSTGLPGGPVAAASVYRVASVQTVPSDGSTRRLAVAEHRLAATTSRTVVPSREPSAFLTAKVTYRGELPLIAGPLASFADGAYVGSSFLKRLRSGGDADLVFGIDQQLLVTVVDLADRKGSTGIFGKRRTVAQAYEVRVLNRRPKPVDVTVLDVLPISQDEEITVELDRDSTQPTARDVNDTPGLLAWTRQLDSGEQLVVRFAYTVSYPKDRMVTGL